jgi:hypothetical protein
LALLCLIGGPLLAQRGGYGQAGRGAYTAPQLPPGTYLNGVPGPQHAPGLNGVHYYSNYSNRTYQSGCYGNCNTGRGGRYSRSTAGFVPLFSGYAFPSYFSGYDDSGPVAPPIDPTTVALTNEVDRLRGDLDQMKAQTREMPPAPVAAPPAVPEQSLTQPPEPATVIVLRDGRRFESTNYAIMDQTLWNFSARPVQKIPIGSIDVSASEKANADRGVDFSVAANTTR